jgi:hypothetical protein
MRKKRTSLRIPSASTGINLREEKNENKGLRV